MMKMSNQRVFILSDKKGIGKTTSLQKWIEHKTNVVGFLSPIVDGIRMFQIIETGEFIPMETKSQDFKIGKYVFDKTSFEMVEKIVLKAFMNQCKKIIVIDEIGPLEINKNQGFHSLVQKLINTINSSRLFFVVRESCLNDFIIKYKLSKVEVLNLTEFKSIYLSNN